ncbi:MAG: helix-turn-helix domain-containing protein, partial [Clostridium sp.]
YIMLLQSNNCRLSQNDIVLILSQSVNSEELTNFSLNIIDPIKQYDKENHSELYVTLESFINNDGNFKRVAEDLFQHENTIRYRIKKIKSILNMEDSNIKFIESTSIALKFMGLLQSQ